MKYYQEITILETYDLDEKYIMNKFFIDLHKSFVNFHKISNLYLPISFPLYDFKKMVLGNKIRIFFNEQNEYKKLDLDNRLRKYNDFIHFSGIRIVPEICKYGQYTRKQSKSNVSRLVRRYAKRNNIEYDKALQKYKEVNKEYISLPYIELYSSSTKQKYKLFIHFNICDSEKLGEFNSFGLSQTATVPIF